VECLFQSSFVLLCMDVGRVVLECEIMYTIRSRFATVHFTTIHFSDPCPVGPSTPDLWCMTVATQVSFLYLVRF